MVRDMFTSNQRLVISGTFLRITLTFLDQRTNKMFSGYLENIQPSADDSWVGADVFSKLTKTSGIQAYPDILLVMAIPLFFLILA